MSSASENARPRVDRQLRRIFVSAVNVFHAGLTTAFGVALIFASIAFGGQSATAQPAASSDGAGDIMITAVPGATPVAQPGPDTPVPAWAQQSYDAYLQMKAKAGGGTHYTREMFAQMPDWSGVWNHIDGFAWDHNVNPIGKKTRPRICSNIWIIVRLSPARTG